MAQISNTQLLGLMIGGEDGPKRQDQSTAFTAGDIHMIKVLTDATTFSVLSAKDQADATVNMLTANNLTAKEFAKDALVSAPLGGYISAFTASEEVEYYKMPDSNRTQQEA